MVDKALEQIGGKVLSNMEGNLDLDNDKSIGEFEQSLKRTTMEAKEKREGLLSRIIEAERNLKDLQNKILEEEIQFRENPEDGEDFISFITEIPEIKEGDEGEGAIEFFLRPFTQDVYTFLFYGVTAYLHD